MPGMRHLGVMGGEGGVRKVCSVWPWTEGQDFAVCVNGATRTARRSLLSELSSGFSTPLLVHLILDVRLTRPCPPVTYHASLTASQLGSRQCRRLVADLPAAR